MFERGSNLAKCRHPQCQVQVMMCKHVTTGNAAPIEVQPSDDGNILVTGTVYEVVKKEEREKVKARGFVLRKNHFATCAFARSFSKAEQSRPLPANVTRFPLKVKRVGR